MLPVEKNVISLSYFVLSNILAIYISVRLSRLLAGSGPELRRFLIAVANFAFIVYAVVITTGCVGFLSSIGIIVVLISVAVCITPFIRRQREYDKKCLPFKTDSFSRTKNDVILLKISLILFSGFAAVWVFKSFILGTYFGPDDLVYHASITAQWIVDKKITLVPFSYQAHYPFNAEIMSLWFMLPFHSDTYASITSFYWVLLSLVAIITILHSLGYTAASCILISTIFIGSTGVQGTSVQKILQSFSANDLVGPAMVLAGIALLFTNGGLSLRSRSVNSLYCGLMVGYAIGTKISFAPIAVVIVLWLLLRREDINSFRQRTSFVLLFILGLVVTGGFWYTRNVLITGNPLFPAEFGPFQGPFGMDDQYRTKLISWIKRSPTDLNQWLHIARDLGNWPFHYGIISMVGYITGIYFLIKNWPNRVNVVWQRQTLLFIAGLILFLTFFVLPYSATTNHPSTGLRAANRYLICSFAIGLLLFGRLIEGNSRGAKCWKLLTFVSLCALAVYKKELIVYAVFALAGAVVYFRPLSGMVTRVVKLKHAGAFFLTGSVAFLIFWYPCKTELTDKSFYSSIGPAGGVFKELEKFPDASRIGFFGTLPYNNTPFYRLFGRRLQMVPVRLDYDGSVPVPLHARLFGKGDSWWDEWDKLNIKINEHAFRSNILQSGVQYVIMAKFPYYKWPAQYDIFKGMGNAMQIYDDGYSAIWKVLEAKPDAK